MKRIICNFNILGHKPEMFIGGPKQCRKCFRKYYSLDYCLQILGALAKVVVPIIAFMLMSGMIKIH